METAVGTSTERCDSPADQTSPLCFSLLRAACRSVAAPDVTSPVHRRDVTTAADVITDGPRRSRAPVAEGDVSTASAAAVAADADVYFEYDLETSALAVTSLTIDGGADTGCALTSPTDGSRESSAASPPRHTHTCGVGDGLLTDNGAVYSGDNSGSDAPQITNNAQESHHDCCSSSLRQNGVGVEQRHLSQRHMYANPLAVETATDAVAFVPSKEAGMAAAHSPPLTPSCPVPVPPGRRVRDVTHRIQQSPTEKVDAWLRTCDDVLATDDADDDAIHHGDADDDNIISQDEADCGDDTGRIGEKLMAAEARTSSPIDADADKAIGVSLSNNYHIKEESLLLESSDQQFDIRSLLTRGQQLLEMDRTALSPPPPPVGCRPDSLQVGPELDVENNADTEEQLSPVPAYEHIFTSADDENERTLDEEEEEDTGSAASSSEEFISADRLKRSSSLKSSKTPPLTPGRKKFVRFADSLGLDLLQVRTFRDEVPTVPAAAYLALGLDHEDELLLCSSPDASPCLMSFPAFSGGGGGRGGGWPLAPRSRQQQLLSIASGCGRRLVPLFLQPSSGLGFEERLRRDKVCLVSVTCHEDDWSVRGVVRVLNMDYYKSVCVRYTLDEWRTWSTATASYVPGSCDGFADRFQFTIYCDTLSVGQRVHFAVAFRCQGQEFWDNNHASNYTVLCALAGGSDLQDEWSGGRF